MGLSGTLQELRKTQNRNNFSSAVYVHGIFCFTVAAKSGDSTGLGKAETNIIIIVSVVIVAVIVGILIICWIMYKKKSAALVGQHSSLTYTCIL